MAEALTKMAAWRRAPALPVEPSAPSAATLDEIAVTAHSSTNSAAVAGDVSPNGEATAPPVKAAATNNVGKRGRTKRERAEP
jgi:hypothetical protein